MIILSVLFIITSILYSSVGFGGGSTYLAILLIWEIPYYIFPAVALICNIIVVSGNSFNYIKAGNYNIKLLLPFLFGSIPFAFYGGTLKIEKEIFEVLLLFVLSIAGILLLISNKSYENKDLIIKKLNFFFSFFLGSILGLVAGIVGIGGGIFLSPILFLLKAEKPKIIATTASLFILINSISGFFGQILKENVFNHLLNYWPLFLSVFIGGLIGNYLNIRIFSNRTLTIMTSLLVIFVAIRMALKIF